MRFKPVSMGDVSRVSAATTKATVSAYFTRGSKIRVKELLAFY